MSLNIEERQFIEYLVDSLDEYQIRDMGNSLMVLAASFGDNSPICGMLHRLGEMMGEYE
jgi:hypothetical protein